MSILPKLPSMASRVTVLGVILGLIGACAAPDNTSPPMTGVVGQPLIAASFKDLADRSTHIVVGQIVSKDDTINMARDVNDINQAASDVLGLGQKYTVEVERYVKGQGDNTLIMVQPEAFLSSRMPKTAAAIAQARAAYPYIEPDPKKTYLFFLDPLGGFAAQQYFGGVAHPSRFEITSTAEVIPETAVDGAVRVFPSRPLAEVLTEIGAQ
ncbi:MAG: hypothetical protein MI924_35035 [Chloroflexales bacterium]|nr:hypothetical protein [Chloroflexales bacterium]